MSWWITQVQSWVDPIVSYCLRLQFSDEFDMYWYRRISDWSLAINTTCRCTLVPWGLFVLVYSLLAAIAVQVAMKPIIFCREQPQTLTMRPLVLPDPLQPTHSMQHLSLRAFGDCTHHFGQGLGYEGLGEGAKRWTHPVLGQMVVGMMIDDNSRWFCVTFRCFP